VIIVFSAAEHPDWGVDGGSAGAALDYLAAKITELLGNGSGLLANEVRLARPRNHSVKCWLDDPGDDDAFTVDAMPALRQAGGELLVPEKQSERWIRTHPEYLIAVVRERQTAWSGFRPLVRVLKLWNDRRGGGLMKSLVVEVLALENLPEETSRARALQRFFQAAVNAIDRPIEDPAELCGEIQPDLDRNAARELLDGAASWSWKAVNAQDAGQTDQATCMWREVFGGDFPEPEDGCPLDGEDEESAGLFNIGVGAAAAAAAGRIGVDRPRPVTDAPQG
jgi:hypothetical protein